MNSLKNRPKSPIKTTRDSKLFKTIIEAIQEKNGQKIVSLDLTNIEEAVSDFFILCEADTSIQINTIAKNIEQKVFENCNENAYHSEYGDEWTLVDFVNIVVHVFKPEERRFYDIENLWMDSGRMEHNIG